MSLSESKSNFRFFIYNTRYLKIRKSLKVNCFIPSLITNRYILKNPVQKYIYFLTDVESQNVRKDKLH